MAGTAPDLGRIRDIVRRHVPSPEYRVFLFGSRATGSASPRSDWDIGILGPDDVPGQTLQRIGIDLEDLPTLHRIDVVDLHAVSDSFRREAMKQVRPL